MLNIDGCILHMSLAIVIPKKIKVYLSHVVLFARNGSNKNMRKCKSIFERESLQKMEASFMLHELGDTYLFDNYNKHVIYLLNFRLDLYWLGLGKKYLFLFLCILDIFQ